MIDRAPSEHSANHEEYLDLHDVGLIRQIVDPKEVKLSKEVDDASSVSAIGHRYVDGLEFANKHGIDLKYLDGSLNNVRSQIGAVAHGVKDPEGTLINYFSDMPDSLAGALNVSSGDVLGRLHLSSDEVLHEFLIWNSQHVARIAKEKQPELDDIKEEFAELMQGAMQRGLPLSQDQLESRLADNHMTFADPVSLAYRKAGGLYRNHDRLIQVAITKNKDELKRSSFHELTHLISGNTIVRDVDADFPDDEMMMSLHVQRAGLADKAGNNAPLWMTEALTEQLTQVITADQQIDFQSVTKNDFFKVKSGTYRQDRAALSVMINDVPAALAAYFEDATPDNDGRLPNNDYFWSQLEHEYGQGVHDLTQSYEGSKGRRERKKFEGELRQLRATKSIRESLPHLVSFDRE